jgi:hypothetical protein
VTFARFAPRTTLLVSAAIDRASASPKSHHHLAGSSLGDRLTPSAGETITVIILIMSRCGLAYKYRRSVSRSVQSFSLTASLGRAIVKSDKSCAVLPSSLCSRASYIASV